MPTDGIRIATITAIAGIVGGVMGALASPLGKDWVARRDFERRRVLDDVNRVRVATLAGDIRRREDVQRTLEHLAQAMQHYDAEWRGIASYHAQTEALKVSQPGLGWRPSAR